MNTTPFVSGWNGRQETDHGKLTLKALAYDPVIQAALLEEQIDLLKILISRGNGMTHVEILRQILGLPAPKMLRWLLDQPEFCMKEVDRQIGPVLHMALECFSTFEMSWEEQSAASLTAKRELFHLLLQHGADPSLRGKKNYTTLHALVSDKRVDLEMVRMVLNTGTDVNLTDSVGQTPVTLAIDEGLPTVVVSLLIDHGSEVRLSQRADHSLFFQKIAVSSEIMKSLFRSGADISGLKGPSTKGVIDLVFKDNPEFFLMALKGQYGFRWVLPPKTEALLVQKSLTSEHLDLLQALKEYHGDVEFSLKDLVCDSKIIPQTARFARFVLDHGGTYSETVPLLFRALQWGDTELVNHLLAHNPNQVNAVSPEGNVALQLAYESSGQVGVREILQKTASCLKWDVNWRILDDAICAKDYDTIALLFDNGAPLYVPFKEATLKSLIGHNDLELFHFVAKWRRPGDFISELFWMTMTMASDRILDAFLQNPPAPLTHPEDTSSDGRLCVPSQAHFPEVEPGQLRQWIRRAITSGKLKKLIDWNPTSTKGDSYYPTWSRRLRCCWKAMRHCVTSKPREEDFEGFLRETFEKHEYLKARIFQWLSDPGNTEICFHDDNPETQRMQDDLRLIHLVTGDGFMKHLLFKEQSSNGNAILHVLLGRCSSEFMPMLQEVFVSCRIDLFNSERIQVFLQHNAFSREHGCDVDLVFHKCMYWGDKHLLELAAKLTPYVSKIDIELLERHLILEDCIPDLQIQWFHRCVWRPRNDIYVGKFKQVGEYSVGAGGVMRCHFDPEHSPGDKRDWNDVIFQTICNARNRSQSLRLFMKYHGLFCLLETTVLFAKYQARFRENDYNPRHSNPITRTLLRHFVTLPYDIQRQIFQRVSGSSSVTSAIPVKHRERATPSPSRRRKISIPSQCTIQ